MFWYISEKTSTVAGRPLVNTSRHLIWPSWNVWTDYLSVYTYTVLEVDVLWMLLSQWVYCFFLFCYNCFRDIHDVKCDVSDVHQQHNVADKNHRLAALPPGCGNGVNRTPFPLVKNPLEPAKIWLLCTIWMCTLCIYTNINWLCSRRSFFSPHPRSLLWKLVSGV